MDVFILSPLLASVPLATVAARITDSRGTHHEWRSDGQNCVVGVKVLRPQPKVNCLLTSSPRAPGHSSPANHISTQRPTFSSSLFFFFLSAIDRGKFLGFFFPTKTKQTIKCLRKSSFIIHRLPSLSPPYLAVWIACEQIEIKTWSLTGTRKGREKERKGKGFLEMYWNLKKRSCGGSCREMGKWVGYRWGWAESVFSENGLVCCFQIWRSWNLKFEDGLGFGVWVGWAKKR